MSGDLVYWQVVRAPALATTAGNPRAVEAQQEIHRGAIVDRHGVVLAQSSRSGNVYQRHYSLPSLSPLIGYSSIRYGQDGLEKTFNSALTGSSGDIGAALSQMAGLEPRTGDSLTLSIDARLQQATDQALGNASGAAILMKPATGEILALVTKPYFDANALDAELPAHQHDASGPFFNRATLGLFPPGSIFKIVTASAALAAGTATPQTHFHQVGDTFMVDGYAVHGANLPPGLTDVNLTQAFQYSCNPCFAQVGLKLGWPALQQYAHQFGIGQPVPFDIPVRESRLFDPGAQLTPVLLANTAYGQGQLLVTPLQILLATAAIANAGTIPRPRVVISRQDPAGHTVARFNSGSLGQAVSASVADEVRQMMIAVVQHGSGTLAAIPNVQVAGKTGTAETGNGQRPDAWFAAFAPADSPRYAVVVIREHQGEGYDQAAPMAKVILQAALASGD
ncbi:MAG: peptidoglycan D,D-transpeptidase FtsI family protein [Chloroflexota bacterium]